MNELHLLSFNFCFLTSKVVSNYSIISDIGYRCRYLILNYKNIGYWVWISYQHSPDNYYVWHCSVVCKSWSDRSSSSSSQVSNHRWPRKLYPRRCKSAAIYNCKHFYMCPKTYTFSGPTIIPGTFPMCIKRTNVMGVTNNAPTQYNIYWETHKDSLIACQLLRDMWNETFPQNMFHWRIAFIYVMFLQLVVSWTLVEAERLGVQSQVKSHEKIIFTLYVFFHI